MDIIESGISSTLGHQSLIPIRWCREITRGRLSTSSLLIVFKGWGICRSCGERRLRVKLFGQPIVVTQPRQTRRDHPMAHYGRLDPNPHPTGGLAVGLSRFTLSDQRSIDPPILVAPGLACRRWISDGLGGSRVLPAVIPSSAP